MSDKLLPCPFCGEKAQIEKQGFGEDAQFFLSCDEGNGCSVAVVGESEKEVIDEWSSAYAWTLVKELAGALGKWPNIPAKTSDESWKRWDDFRIVCEKALAKVPEELR